MADVFGSVKWEAMDWAGAECSYWTTKIQAGDHHDSRKGWRHHAQDWGGRLDGGPADGGSFSGWRFYPRRFVVSSWWRPKVRNLNRCWHGIRGREQGSTSLCRSTQMTRLIRPWRSQERMAVLQRCVRWFSQNRSKEELLMHLVGAGSLADRRRVRESQVQLPGKAVTVARHLGIHFGEKASFAHKLPRRRQALMTAF